MSEKSQPNAYILPEYVNGSNLIIENDESEILFVFSNRDSWELPGGGVELRERELADEASERETVEEATVLANRQHYSLLGLFVQTLPRTQDEHGRSMFGQVSLFHTRHFDATNMGPGQEAKKVCFMSEGEILRAYNHGEFSPFSSYLRIVGHYLNWKRSINKANYISARLSDKVTFELKDQTITI